MKKQQNYRINEENIEEINFYAKKLKCSQSTFIETLVDILHYEVGHLEWESFMEDPNQKTGAEKDLHYLAEKIRRNP